MMKKTYINPSTDVVTLNVENMMALSTNEASANPSYGMDVKEDRGSRGSRSDYNVWNDDWSK